MPIELTKFNIPVNFEIGKIENDSRFQKTKIWIAHTGENLNNTYFTKELLAEMASTLPYIPIVGFIEKNEDGDNDFSDHRSVISIEKGNVKIRYEGKAYGFLSEDPNPQFEFRGGKEWLTAEGYLWTKFTQSTDIFDESNGIKSQSMEIQDVDGEVDELGRLVFSKGRFSALCILGEDVSPAMAGSTIEYFSLAKDTIQEMIREFSLEKGDLGLNPEDLEFEDINKKKTDDNGEEIAEEEIDPVDLVDPEQDTDEGEGTDPEPEPEPDPEEHDEGEGGEEEFSHLAQFELSHDSLRKTLSQGIRSEYSDFDTSVYVMEVFDTYFYASIYDWRNDKESYIKVEYSCEGDVVSIGEKTEVFAMFVTGEEKSSIETNRVRVQELEELIGELEAYKESIEMSKKEELIESYAKNFDNDEIKDIRDRSKDVTLEELEKEIAYAFFNKNKNSEDFSGARSLSLGATKKEGNKYGVIDKYFTK